MQSSSELLPTSPKQVRMQDASTQKPKASTGFAGRVVEKHPRVMRTLDLSTNNTPTNDIEERVASLSISGNSIGQIKIKAQSAPSEPETDPEHHVRETRRSSWTPRASPRISGISSPRAILKSLASTLKMKRESAEVAPQDPKSTRADHIKKLLLLLEGGEFLQNIVAEYKTLIEGNQKSLDSAASDLWRVCSKCMILEQKGVNLVEVLNVHPDATKDDIPEDVADLNRRFLLILSCFLKNQNSRISLPDSVDWQRIEDVAKWIGQLDCTDFDPFARFIRSCSQDRYSGSLVRLLLLNTYGLTPEKDVPILAKVQQKELKITRIFNTDGSNEELLTLLIDVSERATERPLGRILWQVHFFYNQDCFLTEIKLHPHLKQDAAL